ncbi:hypothetical protein C0995_005167, partial [Termitomyces sp. Mi166
MAIELESSVPMVAPKPVMDPALTPVSPTSSIQRVPSVPYIADPSSPPMHVSLPRFSALATFLIIDFLASLRVVVTGAGRSSCHISVAQLALFILLIYFFSSGTLSSTQEHSSQQLAPWNKGKGKAKATEDDDDDKETAQKLRKELEDFVVPTTFDDKLL